MQSSSKLEAFVEAGRVSMLWYAVASLVPVAPDSPNVLFHRRPAASVQFQLKYAFLS